MHASPVKIAIVGCGALGSFYGARLWRAGHATHFLLRSDYATVAAHGVWIESVDGNFRATPHGAQTPEEIGPCDVVFIGLKTTANDAFGRLLPPLVGPETAIVTLQNGLGNEEQLAAIFGPQNILCGLCFVCANRLAPGHIRHTAYGHIILGEFGRRPTPRTHRVAEVIRSAAVRCELADDLERAHWEKLLWNIPFNGLGVAGAAGYDAVSSGKLDAHNPVGPCLPTDRLLAESRWESLVREVMRELVAISAATGHPIDAKLIELNLDRTRNMGTYKASTLLDFEQGLPLELESMFLEPWRRALKAGVPCPTLGNLCQVLRALASR